eukprot:TRINITY_DN2791_c0_g3_i2.p1 TRINITY_DN2791_c0_g3~~TRINITY_DN2791_c0_g3_i2.p1  ORF type:complete len:101 (-),score=4.16 TRINITY_DN2791_c0_g3_i2:104-406(-)
MSSINHFELNLYNTAISDKGIMALIKAISGYFSLSKLCIHLTSCLCLTDRSAEMLIELLKNNTNIKDFVLFLSGSGISRHGVSKLLEARLPHHNDFKIEL